MAYFDGVKVGDRVWDFKYGWGRILYIDEDALAKSLKVTFDRWDRDEFIWYTLDGKADRDFNQTLFWDKVEFEIPKPPKIELGENKYLIDLDDSAVDNDEDFINMRMGPYSQENGLFRNDEETADKALKAIKRFTKLLALRDQECPNSRGYEFRGGEDNWFISYSIRDNKWDYEYASNYYEADKVYFKTSDDAQKVCSILNSGKFSLED